MKKIVLVIVVAVAVMMTLNSCKRNYKVNYAHVAVDTLQHNDVDTAKDIYEEPLYDVPDAPGEVSVRQIMNSREAGREAEKIFSGEDSRQE